MFRKSVAIYRSSIELITDGHFELSKAKRMGVTHILYHGHIQTMANTLYCI